MATEENACQEGRRKKEAFCMEFCMEQGVLPFSVDLRQDDVYAVVLCRLAYIGGGARVGDEP